MGRDVTNSEQRDASKGNAPFVSTTAGLVLIASFQQLVWGSASPVLKLCFETFGLNKAGVPDLILFSGVRFLLSGFLVIAVSSLARRTFVAPRSVVSWWHVLVLCAFQTVIQYSLDFIGLSRTTGSVGSVIESAVGFFAIPIAALVFRSERLTIRKVLGCVLGLAGVVLVNLADTSAGAGFRLDGEGFILLSTISAAFSSCFMATFSKREDQFMLVGWQYVLGGAILCAGSIVSGARLHMPAAGWGFAAFVYASCVSAIGYSIHGTLVRHHAVSSVSVFGFLVPVFGVFLSATMLGEAGVLSPATILASLGLVVIGILVVNVRAEKGREAPSEECPSGSPE